MKRTDQYLKQVGANIRKVRHERGLTLKQVSAEIPMKLYAYNKIELGYVSCRLLTLKRISEVLQVDIRDFL